MSARWAPAHVVLPCVAAVFAAVVTPASAQTLEAGSTDFWIFLIASVCLIIVSGLMSGLTVGYMSLDPLKMKVLAAQGTPVQRKQAAKVTTVKKHHNLLLVTLVLANSAAAQTLPIFFDRIVPTYLAIILSVTAILFMGEIIPQAVCTGERRLAIAAFFVPLTRFLMILFIIVAWPVSKLIDWWLGEDSMSLFRRSELKQLIELHAHDGEQPPAGTPPGTQPLQAKLSLQEVNIIKGTLDLRAKTLEDIYVPWREVYKLPLSTTLDEGNMVKILSSGFSRVPVYQDDNEHHVTGFLLVKKLIVVASNEHRKLSSLYLRPPLYVAPTAGMFKLLRQFQNGHSHIALVTEQADQLNEYTRTKARAATAVPYPEGVTILGVVTIEDVLEEIIQEDIHDEVDIVLKHQQGRHTLQRLVTREVGVQRAVNKFRSLAERARKRLHTAGHDHESVSTPLPASDEQPSAGAGAGVGAGASAEITVAVVPKVATEELLNDS